jgi:hypothetical protein
MPWHAKPGCPKHHRAAVERMVNALPTSVLLPPALSEIFDSLDDCITRPRGFSLAEGFDVMKHGGGIKQVPGSRYKCIFHGSYTQNHRKLEDYIERDSAGKISSRRKRDAINVRQLQYIGSAIYSYKTISK